MAPLIFRVIFDIRRSPCTRPLLSLNFLITAGDRGGYNDRAGYGDRGGGGGGYSGYGDGRRGGYDDGRGGGSGGGGYGGYSGGGRYDAYSGYGHGYGDYNDGGNGGELFVMCEFLLSFLVVSYMHPNFDKNRILRRWRRLRGRILIQFW